MLETWNSGKHGKVGNAENAERVNMEKRGTREKKEKQWGVVENQRLHPPSLQLPHLAPHVELRGDIPRKTSQLVDMAMQHGDSGAAGVAKWK